MSACSCTFWNRRFPPALRSRQPRWPMQKEIIQNSRILIVDDQPENVLLLERALRGVGYVHIATLTDSRKALTVFTEFQPDLVATDLRMPHVDGFSLLKQLRSRV